MKNALQLIMVYGSTGFHPFMSWHSPKSDNYQTKLAQLGYFDKWCQRYYASHERNYIFNYSSFATWVIDMVLFLGVWIVRCHVFLIYNSWTMMESSTIIIVVSCCIWRLVIRQVRSFVDQIGPQNLNRGKKKKGGGG